MSGGDGSLGCINSGVGRRCRRRRRQRRWVRNEGDVGVSGGIAVGWMGGDGGVGQDAATSCQGGLTAALVKTLRERAQQAALANDS
jgi:hypothetical protein